MAGSQMNNPDRHQNNLLLQRKANADRSNSDVASPSSSIHRFQKIAQKVISRSSTEAPKIAMNPHKSDANRCNSVAPNVACHPDADGHRHFTHHTASSTNRMAPPSDRFGHQNLSHHKAQDRTRLLQTERSLRPAPTSKDRLASADHSNNGSSMPRTSSSIKESHRLPSHQKATNRPSAIAKADSVPILHRVVEENLASRKLTRISTQMREIPVAEKNTKGHTETKDVNIARDKRPNELCKDCKASIMESVCFINNEGKISAALMHRLHYCKKPGCAANWNHHSSTSPSSKKAPVLKRQAPLIRPQPHRSKNNLHNFAELGDRPSTCPSASSSFQEAGYDSKHQGLILIEGTGMAARSLDGDAESLLTCTDIDMDSHNLVSDSSPCQGEGALDGTFLHSENLQCSFSRQNGGEWQSNGENDITLAGSSISFGVNIHDDDGDNGNHEKGATVEGSTLAGSCLSSHVNIQDHDGDNGNHKIESAVEQDVIDDFKSFCYHGDNEYNSCSEDGGTDTTTTPNSLIKGAFDNFSNLNVEEHDPDSKVSPWKKSSLRQRYLDSLREQEAETVRLRKQEIMARKQAGDWMLDCHMEELLHRLAPNGEARVKVLVEAFETVIHHSDSESSQTHHQDDNQLHDIEQEEQLDNMHLDTSFSN
ncbi:hypothetical protein GOP47_0022174 [Adiantum capillus-veneris]|uniref:Calmodulin-binding domain-containing protein n=1 Tax=Adiantum capillus-veneris TaxID=13818 RepID=A0A9D4U9Q6_ADICA|nr:hypothetical protein GOP47_0022174 [Adiantum capillus-veneris]